MILHIMILDKFLPPFIDFMDENFGRNNHKYVFITSKKYAYGLTPEHNVEFLHTDEDIFITLLQYMKDAEKIILHGLWRDKVNWILYENISLLKKSYWFTWGGDFYFPEKQSLIKRKVIKEIGWIVAYIQEEVDLIRKWYGAKGGYYSCFKYPSNIYVKKNSNKINDNVVNVLVGNSATSTNNHIDVLERISKYKNENIRVYVPLSYGDEEYSNMIIEYGTAVFKDKFLPILDFMPLNKYLDFLSSIDIVLFAHKRQQAMGNTISLLGMGAKIYMDTDSTVFNFFDRSGAIVFDIDYLNLELLDLDAKKNNEKIVLESFSKECLALQLDGLFHR